MEVDPLDVLEKRISALENHIVGENTIPEENVKPLSDNLVDVHNKMTAALSKRDSINSIMKRLDQLEEFLDPTYGDKAGLTPAAKLELILTLEPELRKIMSSLEWIKKTQSSLDSEAMRGVGELTGKLEKLTLVYLDYKEQVDAQTSQVHHLLKQYNDIITSLSASFVQFDQTVTDLEIAAIPKKRAD